MTISDIDTLIEKFNKLNGGSNNYSQRDLLKYLISRIDEIDNKVDGTNNKLDNHISHLSQRVSVVETCIGNYKLILGFIVSLVIGIFGMMFVTMVV